MLLTQAEFAKANGWSQPYVTKLKKQGKLVIENSKVNAEESLKRIKKSADPARALAQVSALPPAQNAMDTEQASSDAPSFSDARTRRELAQAEAAEFELRRKRGMYLAKDEVIDGMVQSGRKIRQQMDAIIEWSDELASLSAAGGGAEDIRKFLKTKVRALEQKIADTLSDIKVSHESIN